MLPGAICTHSTLEPANTVQCLRRKVSTEPTLEVSECPPGLPYEALAQRESQNADGCPWG